MSSLKMVAIILIVGGILSLSYRGFSYTKETHHADLGAIHLQVNEKEHVYLPVWLGIAAIVGGVLLLASGRKR